MEVGGLVADDGAVLEENGKCNAGCSQSEPFAVKVVNVAGDGRGFLEQSCLVNALGVVVTNNKVEITAIDEGERANLVGPLSVLVEATGEEVLVRLRLDSFVLEIGREDKRGRRENVTPPTTEEHNVLVVGPDDRADKYPATLVKDNRQEANRREKYLDRLPAVGYARGWQLEGVGLEVEGRVAHAVVNTLEVGDGND